MRVLALDFYVLPKLNNHYLTLSLFDKIFSYNFEHRILFLEDLIQLLAFFLIFFFLLKLQEGHA